MDSETIKVVVVDEDNVRKEQIKAALPPYMDIYISGYGPEAEKNILPDEVDKTDIVIFYADDRNGYSIKLFEWLKNGAKKQGIHRIPVLIITKDEFSDRMFELLEISDAEIYEFTDEIDENQLFSKVVSLVEMGELPEEPEDTYETVKVSALSSEKIMGKKFSVVEDPEKPQRSTVISDENMLKELFSAIRKERESAKEVKRILSNFDQKKESEALMKESLRSGLNGLHDYSSSKVGILLDSPEPQTKISYDKWVIRTPARGLTRDLKVLIVSTDPKIEKACNLFFTEGFKFSAIASPAEAVDYFSKGAADIVIIDYRLPDITGDDLLSSIRKQQLGARMPAILVFDRGEDVNLISSMYSISGVKGIVLKPLTKKSLQSAFNSCISN